MQIPMAEMTIIVGASMSKSFWIRRDTEKKHRNAVSIQMPKIDRIAPITSVDLKKHTNKCYTKPNYFHYIKQLPTRL